MSKRAIITGVIGIIAVTAIVFFTIRIVATNSDTDMDSLRAIANMRVENDLSKTASINVPTVANDEPQEIRIYSTKIYVGDKTDEETLSESDTPTLVIYQYKDGSVKIYNGDDLKSLLASTSITDADGIDENTNTTTAIVKDDNIYLINSGDTLTKISAKFGVSVDEIANYNQINNVNIIYANSSLRIPNK